jgi:cytidylate kinase
VKRLVISIDGPSGSGKSTAARGLAKRLGYLYLDTGAMYRAVALKAIRSGLSFADRAGLAALAARSRITFRKSRNYAVRVFLDGTDVTLLLRRPEVTEAASLAATLPGVRKELVRKQQALGAQGGIVAEGRDIGTVVFPKADLKFFLTASPTERARRRLEELKAAGHRVSLPGVLRAILARDRRDRRRAASPLRIARGAVPIDNTKLQSAEVLDKMADYVQRIRK